MNVNTGNSAATLKQGIEAYQRGDRELARYLISQSLQAEPRNEAGWLWLAAIVPDLREVETCLQNALGLSPHNLDTANKLTHVRALLANGTPAASFAPQPIPASSYTPGRSLLDFGSSELKSDPASPAGYPAPLPPAAAYQPPPPAYQSAPSSLKQPQAQLPPRPRTRTGRLPSTPLPLHTSAGPSFVVRALYFVFVGWWVTYIWVTLAWLLNLTIVGLPVGLLMLNLVPQVLTLEPVRTQVITTYTQTGRLTAQQLPLPQPSLLARAIWFVLIGWWLSLLTTYLAAALCVTVIGLPLGLWLFHRLPLITTLKQL